MNDFLSALAATGVPEREYKPPMFFAARPPVLVQDFPESGESFWVTSIKAVRFGEAAVVFEKVFFVEFPLEDGEIATCVVGLDTVDGRVHGMAAELIQSQQAFIDFVQAETARRVRCSGFLSAIINGSEYSMEALVTAAYMIHRPGRRLMAVGYVGRDGQFQHIVLNGETDVNEWLENARNTRPFETLDVFETDDDSKS